MEKVTFRESDEARILDLSKKLGVPFSRHGSIYNFPNEDFRAHGYRQALGFLEGIERERG